MLKEIGFHEDKTGYRSYRGRNNYGKIGGLEMIDRLGHVRVSPLTSKMRATEACHLDIPLESLDEVIAVLTEFAEARDTLANDADERLAVHGMTSS